MPNPGTGYISIGGTAVCSHCKSTLPADSKHFVKTCKGPTNKPLAAICRVCHRAMNNRNAERKRFDLRTNVVRLIAAARCRSRAWGKPFSLTLEHALEVYDRQGGCCAISGIPLTIRKQDQRHHYPTNLSLDQIRPGEGYVVGNVQFLCIAVNRLKGEDSLEDVIAICQAVINHQTRKAA